MKFVYEYRTSDNVPHRGTIAASTKEAAYDTLKAQGIKPGKVWEAPGLFNKVFGKGKRWIAIAVLLVALLGAVAVVSGLREQVASAAKELEDITLYEERGQIYGDAPVLAEMQANDYASVFADDLDRFLATYAIPGKIVERKVKIPLSLRKSDIAVVQRIPDSDLDEVKKLKRMVNRMRRELADYVNDGGTIANYVERLEQRQKTEARLYERIKKELKGVDDPNVWKEKNSQLRAVGLPMVDFCVF